MLDSRTILQGCKDENRETIAVRQKLKAYGDEKFENKEQNALMDVLMVWRGRLPQKRRRPVRKALLLLLYRCAGSSAGVLG